MNISRHWTTAITELGFPREEKQMRERQLLEIVREDH